MTAGAFISIEGIEGAGKSTVIQFMGSYLTEIGHDVLLTREPGGSPLAEEIRNLLLFPHSAENMAPETELLLMFASRNQHIKTTLLPALAAGKWVISDRFVDASYAYQGGGRNLNKQFIDLLDQWIVAEHYPDLTFLLDVPPELSAQRAQKRGNQKDRIEEEKADFFTRVREAYLMRAKEDPKRIHIIDASQNEVAVQKHIQEVLNRFIQDKKRG